MGEWEAVGWEPEDLEPEPAIHPAGPVITGTIVSFDPGYAREVRVGQPVLVAILAAAGIARGAWLLVVSLLRRSSGGGARRSWRAIRKGPEYLVTPMRLRDSVGVLREVEIHGYFSPHALQRRDLVRARVRRQRDRTLPPRVERIANLTTGQVLTPHPPTFWSHVGPALVVQALLGVVLLGLLVLCAVLGLTD
ncbi:MAG TPA: hypothetical protein VFR67_12800 [Pilimelia sp.]|nr:hypothetical protein [Pilimelia sp.]